MPETIDFEATARRIAELTDVDSERQVAAQWVNARTGEPYSVAHVNYVAKVCRVKLTEQPRPRFRAAYNAVANAMIVSIFPCRRAHTAPRTVEEDATMKIAQSGTDTVRPASAP